MTNPVKKPPKNPLMIMECDSKTDLMEAVSQLADQRKQFTVVTDDDTKGWAISYTSGPVRT